MEPYNSEALPIFAVNSVRWVSLAEMPAADDAPIILAEEVVPGGKHQGKKFADVVSDEAFCRWLFRERRAGSDPPSFATIQESCFLFRCPNPEGFIANICIVTETFSLYRAFVL